MLVCTVSAVIFGLLKTLGRSRSGLRAPFCGCVFLGKWRSSSESTVPSVLTSGFVQSLEFLKKSWSLCSYFPDLEKVWKRWNLEKMIKSLEFFSFFFSNLQQVLYKWIFFKNLIQPLPYVCSVPRKKLCSCVLRSLLNTCLITLFVEEEIIVLKKVLEEGNFILNPKICVNPVTSSSPDIFFSLFFSFSTH